MDNFLNFFNLGNFDYVRDSIVNSFNAMKTAGPMDIIDILIVAYILYRLMKLLRDTSAARLAKGVIWLLLIYMVATNVGLNTISYIISNSLAIGVTAALIIFQPELRRLLEQLGKGSIGGLLVSTTDPDAAEAAIDATVAACADMAKTKTGVLIVFERKERLGEIVATGTLMDAEPSPELLKNIFFKNSPLHDGALVMREGRICAAGCVLPLSGSQNLSRDLGTRHRAAVGMSESSDSVLVVVSEETGAISVAIGGMLKRHLSPEVLRKVLETELITENKPDKKGISALRNIWKGGAGR
nr:diadenylate cyclase CdaA [uncultured Agathobaculum sp.]